MSLNGFGEYCNPSVENIAKEIFLAMMVLFASYNKTLRISKVTIYETPNCSTICSKESISDNEAAAWMSVRFEEVNEYAQEKGMFEYDDRKVN